MDDEAPMTLGDLAVSCYVYGAMTDYGASLRDLHQEVGEVPDLGSEHDRRVLLRWLNRWQCRQFALKDHELASTEIESWHTEYGSKLPDRSSRLWKLSEEEISSFEPLFASLAARTASTRGEGEDFRYVRAGPTGASKILFALRSHVFAPWDIPIRKKRGFDGSPASYTRFLLEIRKLLRHIERQCGEHGFGLDDLPKILGQPESTPLQLMNEYYWLAHTRGLALPSPEELERWAEWGRSARKM